MSPQCCAIETALHQDIDQAKIDDMSALIFRCDVKLEVSAMEVQKSINRSKRGIEDGTNMMSVVWKVVVSFSIGGVGAPWTLSPPGRGNIRIRVGAKFRIRDVVRDDDDTSQVRPDLKFTHGRD